MTVLTVVPIAALSRIHPNSFSARPHSVDGLRLNKEHSMEKLKLSRIATVQSGLVLNRKEARESGSVKKQYKRLSLRSLGDDGSLKINELDEYNSAEILDQTVLTQEKDIVARLFAPIFPVTIQENETGFVIPSQLAVIRLKNARKIMPDYLRWYLSVPLVTDKILLKEGWQMQRAIKISTLSDIYIPIPPLQKQRLIVQICTTGMKRESLYRELIEQEKLYMNAQIQKIIGGTVE